MNCLLMEGDSFYRSENSTKEYSNQTIGGTPENAVNYFCYGKLSMGMKDSLAN